MEPKNMSDLERLDFYKHKIEKYRVKLNEYSQSGGVMSNGTYLIVGKKEDLAEVFKNNIVPSSSKMENALSGKAYSIKQGSNSASLMLTMVQSASRKAEDISLKGVLKSIGMYVKPEILPKIRKDIIDNLKSMPSSIDLKETKFIFGNENEIMTKVNNGLMEVNKGGDINGFVIIEIKKGENILMKSNL